MENIIDTEPCICEENRICTDVNIEDDELEFPDCHKANPTYLCCKYCPARINGICKDPCAGIFKEDK